MGNRIGSIFWLFIGGYTAVGAIRLGIGSVRQPGPGFIFFLAGLLLVSLSIVDLGKSLVRVSKTDPGQEPLWSGVRWPKVLLVFIGMSVYLYIFKFLGFFVCTFLLMIFLFKAVETTKWWASILGSLITILIVHGIFKVWLKVPFPAGVFGF
jgi:heme A synthase